MPRTAATARRAPSAFVGVPVALLSSAVFATSGSFGKSLLEMGWSPGAAVAMRLSGAVVILTLPALWSLRGKWHQVRDNWLTIVLFGLFGVAACQLFYFNAVQTLSVGVALLLEYLAPVMIVLWLWVVKRHAPRWLTITGTVVSIAGLLLVLDLGGARVDPAGVLWGVAAAVCLVVYFFITARQNEGLPPLVLASGGMLVGAVVLWIVTLSGIMPLRFTFGEAHLGGASVPWWISLAGMVILSTVIAYVTGIYASRALGSKVASFVSLTEVLFAVVWAWLLLGELPAPIQIGGGLLIVLGVLLVRVDELRDPDFTDESAMVAEAVPAGRPEARVDA
ncbi:EamA family transporter [Arthrobacter woluwensis]|uniref:EamA family transporter n=1 Tax=Arthrobacter woluwensis TaxID=156980 RepID=UPI001AB014BA|nr:DMT family transporter [Arthrobacter woluwensis]QTF72917.1 EamA family transporter [Arthrobacter woluwensis]